MGNRQGAPGAPNENFGPEKIRVALSNEPVCETFFLGETAKS
jgi:hypothetical protein